MNRFAIKYHREIPAGLGRKHKALDDTVRSAKLMRRDNPGEVWVRIEIPVMICGPPQEWQPRGLPEIFDLDDENVEQIIDESVKFATELVDRAMEVYNSKKRTREEILAFIAGGELDEEKK